MRDERIVVNLHEQLENKLTANSRYSFQVATLLPIKSKEEFSNIQWTSSILATIEKQAFKGKKIKLKF